MRNSLKKYLRFILGFIVISMFLLTPEYVHGVNPFQERKDSYIPMFDIDPRDIPRELRPPSYMERLDTQRNITEEIRIDAVRIDWFNNRIEILISGFIGDPYIIRFAQHINRGGSFIVPEQDLLSPDEGRLIIFDSYSPLIYSDLVLEKGKYYQFTIFDNYNIPHDIFLFQSPYDFDPKSFEQTLLTYNQEGKGKDFISDEGNKLVKTNDPAAAIKLALLLLVSSFIYYKTKKKGVMQLVHNQLKLEIECQQKKKWEKKAKIFFQKVGLQCSDSSDFYLVRIYVKLKKGFIFCNDDMRVFILCKHGG